MIKFIASFPDLQSSIQIGGDGATRIKLDIPASEIAEVVKLTLLRGKAFQVSIEPIEEDSWLKDIG